MPAKKRRKGISKTEKAEAEPAMEPTQAPAPAAPMRQRKRDVTLTYGGVEFKLTPIPQTVEFVVRVPFTTSVEYKVKVKQDTPEKMYDQAMAILLDPDFDPNEWSTDPDFYGAFGDGWRKSVEELAQKSTTAKK